MGCLLRLVFELFLRGKGGRVRELAHRVLGFSGSLGVTQVCNRILEREPALCCLAQRVLKECISTLLGGTEKLSQGQAWLHLQDIRSQ